MIILAHLLCVMSLEGLVPGVMGKCITLSEPGAFIKIRARFLIEHTNKQTINKQNFVIFGLTLIEISKIQKKKMSFS